MNHIYFFQYVQVVETQCFELGYFEVISNGRDLFHYFAYILVSFFCFFVLINLLPLPQRIRARKEKCKLVVFNVVTKKYSIKQSYHQGYLTRFSKGWALFFIPQIPHHLNIWYPLKIKIITFCVVLNTFFEFKLFNLK